MNIIQNRISNMIMPISNYRETVGVVQNKRNHLTDHQKKELEKNYLEDPKPSQYHRQNLASELKLTPRAIQVWFQNRRAKDKVMPPLSMEAKNKPENLNLKELIQPINQPVKKHNIPFISINNEPVIESVVTPLHNNLIKSPCQSPLMQNFELPIVSNPSPQPLKYKNSMNEHNQPLIDNLSIQKASIAKQISLPLIEKTNPNGLTIQIDTNSIATSIIGSPFINNLESSLYLDQMGDDLLSCGFDDGPMSDFSPMFDQFNVDYSQFSDQPDHSFTFE